ncbi:MAG: M23 family metallopeptidase [Oligoflexia bacterium]|nr:M23 family metallopeptidase [Oligoflexia bacterium]
MNNRYLEGAIAEDLKENIGIYLLIIISLFFVTTFNVTANDIENSDDDITITTTQDATPVAVATATATNTNQTTNNSLPIYNLFPGKSILLKYPLPENLQNIAKENIILTCNNIIIPFYISKNKLLHAYIAESYFSTLKPYNCSISISINNKNDITNPVINPVTSFDIAAINITAINYPTEYLTVNRKKLNIPKKFLNKLSTEKDRLQKIYNSSNPEPYFQENFRLPLNSELTSKYGVKRIFNKKKNSFHLGLDFRAASRTPISATNDGRVVFIGNLFFSGKTIIIDHGIGIFTMYAHLSKYKIRKGVLVKKNQIIGYSGRSGRVSGPHLHWGVRIHNNWIDGQTLVQNDNLKNI